jgi:ribosomal protein S12 methylthiotransferase accessory factor YcaO
MEDRWYYGKIKRIAEVQLLNHLSIPNEIKKRIRAQEMCFSTECN